MKQLLRAAAAALVPVLLLCACSGGGAGSSAASSAAPPASSSASSASSAPSAAEGPGGGEAPQPPQAVPAPVWQTRVFSDHLCAPNGTEVLTLRAEAPFIANEDASPAYAALNADLEAYLRGLLAGDLDALGGGAQESYELSASDVRFSFVCCTAEYSFERAYETERCVSLVGEGYFYTGGAHGDYARRARHYGLADGETLTLGDFLSGPPEQVQARLLALVQEQAAAGAYGEIAVEAQTVAEYFDPERFYLTPEGFVFYFGTYELGPFAMGIPVYTIPYDALSDLLIAW